MCNDKDRQAGPMKARKDFKPTTKILASLRQEQGRQNSFCSEERENEAKTIVDLPSQSLARNRQYRDTVTCLPTHTEQKIVTVAKVRKSVPEVAVSRYCSHQHTNNIRKRSRTPNEPMMHDNDKTCFTFQPACLCPNS